MLGRNYRICIEPLSERDVIGKDAKGEIKVSFRAQHNKSFERDAPIAWLSSSCLKFMLDATRSARRNSGVMSLLL